MEGEADDLVAGLRARARLLATFFDERVVWNLRSEPLAVYSF